MQTTGTKASKQPPLKMPKEIKVKYASGPAPLAAPDVADAAAPPEKFSATRDGWSCTPSAEDESWNCHLTGADPKGEAQIFKEEEV